VNKQVTPLSRGRAAAVAASGLCAALGLVAVLLVPVSAAFAQVDDPISIDNTGPRAVKLGILLAVFLVILFGMRHVRVPDMVRSALIWTAILIGLVGLYALRVPLESAGREFVSVLVPGMAISDGERVTVRRAYQGQFIIGADVNGAPVDFLFDTGASLVVLAAEDARAAGFDPETLDYRIPVMTAAGITRVAPVRVREINVGGIREREVRAAVARPGELDTSLLGMTFLDRLSGYEVRRDRLVLNP